jgi:hypothetical protein
MRHVQHLSLESLVKMDHFQKEQPLNLKGTTGAREGRNVRFGSKADMRALQRHVRFIPRRQTFGCISTVSAKGQKRTSPLQFGETKETPTVLASGPDGHIFSLNDRYSR